MASGISCWSQSHTASAVLGDAHFKVGLSKYFPWLGSHYMHPARHCGSCDAHVQTAGCRQQLDADALLTAASGAAWPDNTVSLESVFCPNSKRAQNTVREELSTMGADWRNKACYEENVPAPAWVNYILQIFNSITSSKGTQCWSLYPVANCCARLWQSAAVTFSPRHGYIPGAGDAISVCFLLPRPAELVLNLTFCLWKTLGILG